MNHELNLVPAACLDYRSRARRQLAWSVIATSLGAMVFAGWLTVGRARDNYALHDGHFSILQAQETDLELKLTRASRERASLFERARKAMWLRPENRVPDQLLALARLTPAGVTISDLRVSPFSNAVPIVSPQSTTGSKPVTASAQAPAPMPPFEPRRMTRPVQIGGWAANFSEVQRFVEAIASVPCWTKVELVKSTREMRDGREMIQFRVDCTDAEGVP